jgi:HEPN domain-containing protein
MPPDLAEVQEWLRKASRDRRMAEAGLAAGFHFQQAAEKLLKGFLFGREREFEKTRDLRDLVLACAEVDSEFAVLLPSLAPLTGFAVRFRYPGPADPTVNEVREALRVVGEVWQFVTSRLPPEVVPGGGD